MLAGPFAGPRAGPAEENLQARIRGNLLMALSNKFGWLVLTTGNKCEMAVGYSTLYGDMAGGFAVIKDVPKTLVYGSSATATRRRGRELDPGVDHRPRRRRPSCAPTSATTDSLPPYEVLDPILEAYVEDDLGREQIVARGLRPRATSSASIAAGRPHRVQAPPGAARASRSRRGVRPRPAPADHQPLRRLSRRQQASGLERPHRFAVSWHFET